jgi:MFS family permease
MTDDRGEPFRIQSLTTTVFLPNFLFAVGQGAVIPVIALLALELGASTALAGAIVALRGLGTMAFDVPAGVLVARVGEKRAMVVAAAVLGVLTLAIGFQPSLGVYALLVFGMGGTWSVFLLARLAYAAESSPVGHRGRVMSMLGGVNRMGMFLGPVISAIVVIPLGLGGPFFVQALFAVFASVTLLVAVADGGPPHPDRSERVTLTAVLGEHRRILGVAGFVAVAAQVLRSSRQAIIPLWGDQIGLGASAISLIFGASSAIEILLFYPVGIVMDRRGRKWAALPFISLLSVGIAAIPLTKDLTSLTLVALFIGLANGLGAGFNMTLGSDLSPALGRSQFLGLWRLVSDIGTAGGPLLVAAVTSLASLGAAAVATGGVGVAGVLVLWLAVPETRTGRA